MDTQNNILERTQMLSHSTDRYETGLYSYNLNQPPVSVQLPSLSLSQQNIDSIASALANVISSLAGNQPTPLRIFAFNYFSKNNWRNNDFIVLLSYTVGYVDVEIAMGTNVNFEYIINELVPGAFATYMPQVITLNPELRAYVDQQTLNNASINSGIFGEKINRIMALYGRAGIQSPITQVFQQSTQFQQGGQFGQYPNQNYGNQRQYNQMPSNVYGQNQGITRSSGIFNQGSGQQTSIGNGLNQADHFSARNYNYKGSETSESKPVLEEMSFEPTGHGSRWSLNSENQPVQENQGQVKHIEVPELEMVETSQDNWKPNLKQPHLVLMDPRCYRRRYFIEGNDVIEIIEPREENEIMDRDKHSIFHWNNSPEKVTKILDTVGQQVEQMKQFNSRDVKAARSDITSEKAVEVTKHIDTHQRCEGFLEDAVFQAKRRMAIQKKISSCDVYRSFVVLAKPLITCKNFRSFLDDFFTISNFNEMAVYLKNFTDELLNMALTNEGETSQEKAEETSDLLMVINEINTRITELINDILRNRLSLRIKIDNFMEDFGTLSAYLNKRFGNEVQSAFERIMGSLIRQFSLINEDAEMELAASFNEEEDTVLTYTFLPRSYSLTIIDVLASDLVPKLDTDIAVMIPEDTYPLLYNLAKSADDQRESMDFIPDYNLLITADNKMFKMYRGGLVSNSYLIAAM